jgi:hypothetical protein
MLAEWSRQVLYSIALLLMAADVLAVNWADSLEAQVRAGLPPCGTYNTAEMP